MAESLDRLKYGRIGDYVLVRVIGRGTHYTLYQAADPQHDRMVVIKALHVSEATAPAVGTEGEGETPTPGRETARVLEARLTREADALARLDHPNVVALYGTGEQDGLSYLVTEYVYGHPLRQRLDTGPLPLSEAVDVLTQLAEAVDAAHAEGILHRDIRPTNVLLRRDGRVKLADFGLARQPDDATVTLMGALVGEPAYLAPECLRGTLASPASDLWALGVLLYESLAGHPPFEGANFPLVAHQIVMGTPTPMPGASPTLQIVLDRALEKDPARRYHSAGELAAAFRKAAGSPPASATASLASAFLPASPLVLSMPGLGSLGPASVNVKSVAAFTAGALALTACILLGIHLSDAASGPTPAPPPAPSPTAVVRLAPSQPSAPALVPASAPVNPFVPSVPTSSAPSVPASSDRLLGMLGKPASGRSTP